jgi:ABC-type dipeptide/oligopeptide/nickel transport system permease subunit
MAESITAGVPVAAEATASQRRASQVGLGAFCRRFSRQRLPMAGVIVVTLLTLMSIVGPWLLTTSPIAQDVEAVLDPPSADHWFGTDELGRDIFARVVYGGRVSLQVGIISTLIALVIGTGLGMVAGYWGGSFLDNAIMRGIDALLAFPSLVLAIAITAVLGPNLQNAMLAIGIVNIPSFARLVRGQVLSIGPMEYIQAARTLGATDARILTWHVLPNTLGPIVVLASLRLAFAVLAEASLSFLGLGAQPPIPTWGSMLNFGRSYLEQQPWVSFFPGMAIFLTVLGFSVIGDGLRDTLDPRMKVGRAGPAE